LFPQKGDEELEMKVELKLMLHVAAFVFGSKKQQYDGSIDGTSNGFVSGSKSEWASKTMVSHEQATKI